MYKREDFEKNSTPEFRMVHWKWTNSLLSVVHMNSYLKTITLGVVKSSYENLLWTSHHRKRSFIISSPSWRKKFILQPKLGLEREKPQRENLCFLTMKGKDVLEAGLCWRMLRWQTSWRITLQLRQYEQWKGALEDAQSFLKALCQFHYSYPWYFMTF